MTWFAGSVRRSASSACSPPHPAPCRDQGVVSALDVIAHGPQCAPWRQPGDKESVPGLLVFPGLTPLGVGFDSRRRLLVPRDPIVVKSRSLRRVSFPPGRAPAKRRHENKHPCRYPAPRRKCCHHDGRHSRCRCRFGSHWLEAHDQRGTRAVPCGLHRAISPTLPIDVAPDTHDPSA